MSEENELDTELVEGIRERIAELEAEVAAARPKRDRWKEDMENLQAEAEDALTEFEEYDGIVTFGLEEIDDAKAEARDEYRAIGIEIPAEFSARDQGTDAEGGA